MADETPIPAAPADRNAARAAALFRALRASLDGFDEAVKRRDMAELAGDQRRQRALQRNIDELLARLADPKTVDAFAKPLGAAYTDAFTNKEFGTVAPQSAINKEQIKALADGFVQTAQSALAKTKSNLPYIASRVLTPEESDQVREAAIEATARGLTSKQFAKKLLAPGMPVGARAFEEDGRLWVAINANRRMPADVYADSMARTMTYHAANRGTLARCEELGVQTVLVAKNPGTIDFCLDLEGKVYALNAAAAERYQVPLLADCPNGGPPFHPNCRHQTAPFPMVKRQIGKVPTAPADVLTRDKGRDARTEAQAAFKRRLEDDPKQYADVIGESAARRGWGNRTVKLRGRDKALIGQNIPGLPAGAKEEFGENGATGAVSEDVHLFKRMKDSGIKSRKELRQTSADAIRAGVRGGDVVATDTGRLIYYDRAKDWAVIVQPDEGLIVSAFPIKDANEDWERDYVAKYK